MKTEWIFENRKFEKLINISVDEISVITVLYHVIKWKSLMHN